MIPFSLKYILILGGTFFISVFLTPLIRLLAFRIGAVDYPNARRINKKPMPSAGGLAIFMSFGLATLLMMPLIMKTNWGLRTYFDYMWPVILSAAVIVVTGLIDDVKELGPKAKMAGILLGASMIYLSS